MDKFTPMELLSLIFIVIAVVIRVVGLSKLKDRTLTKEGRSYVASKGGYRLITLDLAIFATVIFMIIAITLKVNFILALIVYLGIISFSLINFFKIIKE
ncbi:MAG: hypothetical protein RR539_10690 [Clostridium sp.]|uniref:hypothetical protein n=1 Tax=Clostridium sp. TaxID=1506 RepID=UPI002FCAF4E6